MDKLKKEFASKLLKVKAIKLQPNDPFTWASGWKSPFFKGCAHPNAAKLWIEYALSPDCVNLAKDNGSYQFLVIDNAEQPTQAAEFGLDPDNVMD